MQQTDEFLDMVELKVSTAVRRAFFTGIVLGTAISAIVHLVVYLFVWGVT